MILFSPTIHPMFHSYTSPRYLTGKATCGGVVPLHFQLRDTRGRAIAPEVDRNGTKTPRKLNIHGAFWRDKPITKLDWLKNPSFGLCFAPLSQIQKMQQFHLLHLFCLYLHDQTRFRLCSPDCNLSLPNSSGCCVISWRHQLYDVQTSYNILRLWERAKKPLTVQFRF